MEKPKGCSEAQKKWILERDQYKCQFLMDDGRICGVTYNQQVHHILPRGWVAFHYTTKDPNVPWNLITLCARHHIGKGLQLSARSQCVHPDTEIARLAYMAGDKQAYHKMAMYRKEMNLRHEEYWNPAYDNYFLDRVDLRNKVMLRPFPYRTKPEDRMS